MEPVGRVLRVNVSPGGVPKLPVERAHVGPLGLAGDAHNDDTDHGGPHRAVALLAIEAIRRVAAEGHPIFPGSCGENLTTEGIELALLPVGSRLAIGERLVLEISKPDNPCSTIEGSFSDRRFARISIRTHPTDSRMYARVLAEGEVRSGDPIRVLPPAADSRAIAHQLLDRLDGAARSASLATWRAVGAAGWDVRVVTDGELAFAAAPDLPGPMFNLARGLTGLPNLIERAVSFFTEHRVDGWLELDPETAGERWATVEPGLEIELVAIESGRVASAAEVDGLTIRRLAPDDADGIDTWARTLLSAEPLPDSAAAAWAALAPHLARMANVTLWLAELDGRPVAAAGLQVAKHVGWLRSAGVIPEARGRGIHRVLVAARAAHAVELGADLVGTQVVPGSPAEANVRRMGLVEVGRRRLVQTGRATARQREYDWRDQAAAAPS
jgi:MOSC domain-containing protein YiiM/GNAT superfamily N-acetyltransferase